MVLPIAALLTVGALVFTLLVRAKDVPAQEPVSPTQHLDERKAEIYDGLRDLQFEYRLGKLSDGDYQKTKLGLQAELAKVLAETDAIRGVQPPPARPSSPAMAPVPDEGADLQVAYQRALQLDIESKASVSRTCGLISIVTIVCTNIVSFILAASGVGDKLPSMLPLTGIIGIGVLVLAIVAVVKGAGAKRFMNQFALDPRMRSKATTGQVCGWITLAIFAVGTVIMLSGGMRLG